MERERLQQLATEMITMVSTENQARMSEILTEITDDNNSMVSANETSTSRIEELTKYNNDLKMCNADLLLKVGVTKSHENNPPEINTDDQPENKVTFESLFNDKGELI